MTKRIIHLNDASALQQEGLSNTPQAWEDGQRLPNQPGFFERWQFDVRLEDGSTLLITFFNKPMLERKAALRPGIAIAFIPPKGKKVAQALQVEANEYSASQEHCYIRAGRSWVRGDTDWNYELDVQAGNLGAHLTFQPIAPPWRPGTGKFTPEDQPRFFGWLTAIPFGSVEGVISVNGKMRLVKGHGYHDHRWGNVDLRQVFSQWYIGRTQIENYALNFLEITTTPAYGQAKLSALMLARDNRILVASTDPLCITEQDFVPDEGGRSYPAAFQGHWQTQQGEIHLGVRDPQLVDAFSLVDFLPTLQRLVGGLVTNPYHFTFSAGLDLDINIPDQCVRGEGKALYELALLG